jgi:hypothetical protein
MAEEIQALILGDSTQDGAEPSPEAWNCALGGLAQECFELVTLESSAVDLGVVPNSWIIQGAVQNELANKRGTAMKPSTRVAYRLGRRLKRSATSAETSARKTGLSQ